MCVCIKGSEEFYFESWSSAVASVQEEGRGKPRARLAGDEGWLGGGSRAGVAERGAIMDDVHHLVPALCHTKNH